MENDEVTLRDIAQRAVDRNGGKAGRALDRAAKARGLTLSYTTVDKILAGTYTSVPKRTTLDALAELASLERDAVYQAAGLPIPLGSLAEQLPPDADLLTGPQRDAVLAVVRQFAAANRALHEDRLSPNVYDPEDVDDFDESENDDELRRRRTARGKDTETGLDPDDPALDDLRSLRDRPSPVLADAARKTGEVSKGQQRRRDADRAGDPPTDDPDDIEPR